MSSNFSRVILYRTLQDLSVDHHTTRSLVRIGLSPLSIRRLSLNPSHDVELDGSAHHVMQCACEDLWSLCLTVRHLRHNLRVPQKFKIDSNSGRPGSSRLVKGMYHQAVLARNYMRWTLQQLLSVTNNSHLPTSSAFLQSAVILVTRNSQLPDISRLETSDNLSLWSPMGPFLCN